MKEIIDELDFNKILKNIFALQKAISREWEKKKNNTHTKTHKLGNSTSEKRTVI